jgi:hypothetical protein
MKIAELLQDYNKFVKKAEKRAFIPNPEVMQQQQAAQQQQQQQAQQQQQQPQGQPPQGQQPQPQPQPQPQQGGQPPQAQSAQADPLEQQVVQMLSQLPEEVQQQLEPLIEQLHGLPPEQKQQQLTQLAQQLSSMMQQGQQQPPQGQPQGGMEAQAADEDLYAAQQAQMGDPQAMMGGGAPQPQPSPEQAQQDVAEDAGQAEASAIEAKNELDNVKVTLTVRELLDLTSKGTATASLLKVKQLADTHQQKMQQSKQKADTAQQQADQQQQAQQQGMMSGGIYSSPMDQQGAPAPQQ